MRYLGDFPAGGTVYFSFSTQKADGVPITLVSGAVVIRQNDTAAPVTLLNGPALTVDLNSKAGLHNVKAVLTISGGNLPQGDYDVCLSAGTVNGISVVGRVLAHFSIENRVSNVTQVVGSAQSALDLKDFADDGYDPATNKVAGVLLTDATATVNGIANGAITANAIAANAITNAKVADDVVVEVGTKTGFSLLADQSGVTIGTVNALATTAVANIWDALMTTIAAAGSIGKLVKDNINAAISSRMATFAYTAPDNNNIGLIKAKTDLLPAVAAGQVSGLPILDATARIPSQVKAIDNGAITAASITDGAITNAKVADDVSVDVKSISGDTGAADNLESAFDGSGYAGGTTKQIVEVNTKTGFSLATPPPTTAEIKTAIEAAESSIALILTHLGDIKGVGWTTETLVALITAINTRLATAGYTAPDNAGIGSIKGKTDKLPDVTAGTTGGLPTVDGSNNVGISQAGADKVWVTNSRSLTDKAGFSLATPPPTAAENAAAAKLAIEVVGSSLAQTLADTTAIRNNIIVSAGNGGILHTVEIRDIYGSLIHGAEVWITSDSAGVNLVAGPQTVDNTGFAYFALDAGTYYSWAQAVDYEFDNPTTEVVE